eukprot:1516484-Pyramimonas_sp.AAC.1
MAADMTSAAEQQQRQDADRGRAVSGDTTATAPTAPASTPMPVIPEGAEWGTWEVIGEISDQELL